MSHATNEQRERVTQIMHRAETMKSAKKEYDKFWELYEKIFRIFPEVREGEDSWRASLPDTWIYATIKTTQAAFSDSTISPVFTPHEDSDLTKAQDLKDLYLDISEKGNMDEELYYARLDAFKLGIGFLKTIYVNDTREVNEIKSFNPETNEIEYEKKTVADFDDPKTVRVSPWLILVDELARADFNTVRDLIEIEVLAFEDAKRKYSHFLGEGKKGENIWDERVKKAGFIRQFTSVKTGVAQTADTNKADAARFKSFRFFAPIELSEDAIEVLHYWNRLEDTYEIIANGEALQVKTPTDPSPIPYIHKEIPYTPIRFSPYSGDEFWAAGIIEIGRAEIESIKQRREMMSDRQKLSLFAPAFSDVNDEIDQKVLKLKPLSIIRTRGGVPQQFVIPGITTADLALLDRDEESFKRAVGVDERVLGISPEQVRLTATEVAFLREAALRRLREFALLYRKAILREVQLKMKLFKQYYSSPFKQEQHIVGDSAVKSLKIKAKEFNVKVGNVYKTKTVNPHMLEGEVDVDIEMRILLPMTQAQVITKWGQILRDAVPFIEAGMLDLSIEEIFKKYLAAFDVKIDTLREPTQTKSIQMAEGEHKLFADENTSTKLLEKILPDGTTGEFLTPEHIKRHRELLESDDSIGEAERKNLAVHIFQDMLNLRDRGLPQGQVNPALVSQVGGVQGTAGVSLPSAQQNAQELPLINQGGGEGLTV